MIGFATRFFVSLFFFLFTVLAEARAAFVPDATHAQFRDALILAIERLHQSSHQPSQLTDLDALDAKWNNPYQKTNWHLTVTPFVNGKALKQGVAEGSKLSTALKVALQKVEGSLPKNVKVRYVVSLDYYPNQVDVFTSFEHHGLELIGQRVAVRTVTDAALQGALFLAKNYLLRMMHPHYYGFSKWYDAATDMRETRLRTVYSASALYTLIQLERFSPVLSAPSLFPKIADFLLSQQVQEGPDSGAFDYGFSPETHSKTGVFVSGTAAKSIFALILLYQKTGSPIYLDAAMRAGDWLVRLVSPKGRVVAVVTYQGENRLENRRYSLLYTGQTLSALSRLYAITQKTAYLEAARRIAMNFKEALKTEGLLLGDDYRPANSISTSWVLMSLMDFLAIQPNFMEDNALFSLADALVVRQITNASDIFSHGRYLDAMTASGNGWMMEVMGQVDALCHKKALKTCASYRHALYFSARWLLQNRYTAQNSWNIPNPENAIGGFITNFNTQTVRTDAVCHAMNAFVYLLSAGADDTENPRVSLTERPFREILPLLRAGKG